MPLAAETFSWLFLVALAFAMVSPSYSQTNIEQSTTYLERPVSGSFWR